MFTVRWILLFSFLGFSLMHVQITQSTEIVATSEWTLVKEGDTIPAGLHIRMDLSTGEKWVKTRDEDNSNTKDEIISIVGKEGTFSAEVQPDGVVALVKNDEVNLSHDKDAGKKKDEKKTFETNYDFAMMHRTLSKLGPEETNRMGLPDFPPNDASPEDKKAFEIQMKTIWTTRQAELAELEVADLPKILKERISSIKLYIHEGSFSFPNLMADEDNMDNDSETGHELIDIVSVLEDLEYQLNDLDNARDFHTLGGWQYLVSLLYDASHFRALQSFRHHSSNTTELYPLELTDQEIEYKQTVQTAAAWAIGTAIKNTEEFFPWVLEDVSKLSTFSLSRYDIDLFSTSSVTVIDLLLHQLRGTYPSTKMQDSDYEAKTSNFNQNTINLQQKIFYALGSILRSNEPAQQYFLRISGPKVLADFLRHITSYPEISKKTLSLAAKIITFGSDMVVDAEERLRSSSTGVTNDHTIIKSFSDETWCEAVPTLLDMYSQEKRLSSQENMMKIMNIMSYLCNDFWDDVTESMVLRIVNEWKGMSIDDEWKHELIDLGDSVLLNMKR